MPGTKRPNPAGEDFGALQLRRIVDLYGDQERATLDIIHNCHSIACSAYLARVGRGEGGEAPAHRLGARIGADPSDFRRPHHAYAIDGKRGTGKTSVLLTLHPYLNGLRLDGSVELREEDGRYRSIELDGVTLRKPPGARGGERAALSLPIVFTEDMEVQETTMEAVFALMDRELEERSREAKADPDAAARINALQRELREEVGVAWTYSRQIGAESLQNDAFNYKEYVQSRAGYNRLAYTKVTTWRRFVDRFLDTLGYEVLVLLFDDSDLNPAVAEDMVRSIRMYFSHPRVLSLVAVDMETLRLTLEARSLAQHRILFAPSAFEGLEAMDQTKRGILDLEAANVRALLDKVLPRPNRHRLSMGDLKHLDKLFDPEGGTADPYGTFCRKRFDEGGGASDRVAWWLLSGPYRRLVAGNLRGIVGFRRLVDDSGVAPLEAILGGHELSALAERAEGSLTRLGDLVMGGVFDEEYSAGRVELDERERRFLDLWCDVEMGAAQLAARSITVVSQLRSLASALAHERSATPDEAGWMGLPSVLQQDLLPRNCLYLHQFRHLETALEQGLPSPSLFASGLREIGSLDGEGLREVAGDLLDRLPAPSADDDRELAKYLAFLAQRPLRAAPATGRYPDQETVLERITLEALVALAVVAAVRVEQPGQARRGIAEALGALSSRDADATDPGKGMVRQAALLMAALPDAERRRQEDLMTWACANSVAGLGDDTTSLIQRKALGNLADTLGNPTGTSERSRLAVLVRESVERSKGPGSRHRLLLAWAVAPCLESLFDFGADYFCAPGIDQAWRDVGGWLDGIVRETRDGPSAWPDRTWSFPDMDDETLRAIAADVKGAAEFVSDLLTSRAPAAGTVPVDGLWGFEPTRRLAALLGASPRWVEEAVGVRGE